MTDDTRSASHEDDIADLEDLARKGGHPPAHARRFRIRVDEEHFTVNKPEITGREILALVSKDPARFKLVQRMRGGGTEVIKPDQVVDLRKPGIERFNTMAVDQTEGEVPRRDFVFTEDDTAFLDALGLVWETIADGRTRWVVIRGYGVPAGYNHASVEIAVQITPGYPDTQLDMVFFHPALARADGRSINATQASASIGGKTYQRWSRHRTDQNPWRPGIDSLVTHMLLVEDWLTREFKA